MRTEAELETVYVPLQVVDPETAQRSRRMQDRPRSKEVEKLLAQARSGSISPEDLAGLPEDLRMELERAQPLTIDEVLARFPVFLLKGAPGSGKTTLLRHVAICLARGQAAEKLGWNGQPLLPILVPLRNFGRFLEEHRSQYTSPAAGALRHFIEDYFQEHELELPPRFFRDRLNEGSCLVMLDGLDEVADRNLRATVAQMVNAFIRHYERQRDWLVSFARWKAPAAWRTRPGHATSWP